jgi:hypothetical protein
MRQQEREARHIDSRTGGAGEVGNSEVKILEYRDEDSEFGLKIHRRGQHNLAINKGFTGRSSSGRTLGSPLPRRFFGD